eukprot:1038849-Pelagomonas_calceolata.AAC.1
MPDGPVLPHAALHWGGVPRCPPLQAAPVAIATERHAACACVSHACCVLVWAAWLQLSSKQHALVHHTCTVHCGGLFFAHQEQMPELAAEPVQPAYTCCMLRILAHHERVPWCAAGPVQPAGRPERVGGTGGGTATGGSPLVAQ